jgi:hypothetical protein
LLPFVVFQLAADASEVSAPGFIAAILFPFTCSAATIRADIARLREALPAIRARARTVDPDRLLAELQLLTGELLEPAGSGMGTASLEREFDALERDTPQPQSQPGKEDALSALKKKMGL